MLNVDLYVHALISSLSICKCSLDEKKQLGFFSMVFFKPEQKEEALQQTRLPMHIPSSSLPCLLRSALLFYHPLSPFCLSLTPAETLLCRVWGDGCTDSISLPLFLSHSPSANIELRCTGEKTLICTR